MKLSNVQFSSWINDALPDVLWSALIAGLLSQEKTIAAFRLVLTIYKRNYQAFGTNMLVHSQLANLQPEVFQTVFEPLCANEEVRQALLPITLIESLPDKSHWTSVLKEKSDSSVGIPKLAEAIAACFDHQSRSSTDCRWLKLMTVMAQDKMKFPTEMANQVDELIHYPDKGDMRSVRPFIRSGEIALRNNIFQDNKTPPWSEAFWQDCWNITHCIPSSRDEDTQFISYDSFFDQIATLYDDLTNHFLHTIKTTGIDAKHDGSFGLVFYTIQMLIFALKAAAGQTAASRLLLRTSLEAYITLCYLTKKDDPTIWMQYRNYGIGQSKLAYLKNISLSDAPSFTTIELLENLANEDMWLEFQDIKLGAWSNKNLREMAIEARVKDIYDKYYDTLSGYVHGNWSAVRHAAFGECLNPLHRFHRIPMPPFWFSESAVPDLEKLVNLSLDQLASLYPPFKQRLRFQAKREKHTAKKR